MNSARSGWMPENVSCCAMAKSFSSRPKPSTCCWCSLSITDTCSKDPAQPLIEFYSFATGKVTQVAALSRPFGYGLSVSPDGRWLLYTQVDQSGSDIMLMENFR